MGVITERGQPRCPHRPVTAERRLRRVDRDQGAVLGGGNGKPAPLADGASYDPASRTWAMLPGLPLRPDGRQAIAWTGTQRQVIQPEGGAAFNPAASAWTTIPALPQAALAALRHRGRMNRQRDHHLGREPGRRLLTASLPAATCVQHLLVGARKPGLDRSFPASRTTPNSRSAPPPPSAAGSCSSAARAARRASRARYRISSTAPGSTPRPGRGPACRKSSPGAPVRQCGPESAMAVFATKAGATPGPPRRPAGYPGRRSGSLRPLDRRLDRPGPLPGP